jgi:hypothetical protein
MKRRSSTWPIVAGLFTLGNIAGTVYAAAMGEMRHATLHIMLTVAGAWFTWVLVQRRGSGTDVDALDLPAPSGELGARLGHLEQSLDAIALEVERVGEGQRYMTKVFTERDAETDKPK